MAHLMKFHLLQWEVVKVKFLMNSNMTLTVLNLKDIQASKDKHQKTDPKVQQDFNLKDRQASTDKHQKTDPKVQQDFKGQGHYDMVKGQIKVTP